MITVSGIDIDVIAEQPTNVKSSIDSREFGNNIEDSDVHPLNAELPIVITESGKTIDPSDSQCDKCICSNIYRIETAETNSY